MDRSVPLVEIWRGELLESLHRGHAVVCDGRGDIVESWGDPETVIYPRSSAKMIQALPLLSSGAADRYGLNTEQLALACASHNGAAIHTDRVSAWLDQLGLGESDFRCGPQEPADIPARNGLILAGEEPCQIHNNCSGKHAGFLTTAKHLGEPTEGYLDPDHPVQKRLHDILVDFGGEDLVGTGRGIDGCGIPVYGMTLGALARAAQRMATPTGVSEERGHAIQRILKAGMTYPYMVAGRARFDTDAMGALDGRVATKAGAEGVHVAIVPSKGLGIVLKVEDGAKRAADVAMGWLLDRYGFLNDAARQGLAAHLTPTITNAAGDKAGIIRIAD